MSFDVRLSRSAERYLDRLPRDAQSRIVERLAQLALTLSGSIPNRCRALLATDLLA